MSRLTKGTTFSDSGANPEQNTVTATKLHELVESATPTAEFITDQTAKGQASTGDKLLLASGGSVYAVPAQGVVPSEGLPANVLNSATNYVFGVLTLGLAGTKNWRWVTDGTKTTLQQFAVGGAGSAEKIPIQILNGAENNTLYLTSTGLAVRKTTPTCALDVAGKGQFTTGLWVSSTVPGVTLKDTDGDGENATACAMFMSGAEWYLKLVSPEDGSGDAYNTPVRLTLGPTTPNNSLFLSSAGYLGLGTATPAYRFDCAGSARIGGDLVLTAAGSAPSSGSAGTAGTLRWHGSDLYVCIATNMWKKFSQATI